MISMAFGVFPFVWFLVLSDTMANKSTARRGYLAASLPVSILPTFPDHPRVVPGPDL